MLNEAPSFFRRLFGGLLLLPLLIVSASCTAKKSAPATYPMGQKVQVGKLSYQVVDAIWRTEIPGGREALKNRALQLHLTITNSAGKEITVPLLRLLDASDHEIAEVAEIEGNSHWMGLIRRLQPSLTEEGHIYFDVPVGAYKLEVVDTSEPDSEKVAYIEIPASLAPPPTPPNPSGM